VNTVKLKTVSVQNIVSEKNDQIGDIDHGEQYCDFIEETLEISKFLYRKSFKSHIRQTTLN